MYDVAFRISVLITESRLEYTIPTILYSQIDGKLSSDFSVEDASANGYFSRKEQPNKPTEQMYIAPDSAMKPAKYVPLMM